jgi:hypothetical protein
VVFVIQQNKNIKKNNLTEVIVIVHCADEKELDVIRVLWEQYALGIGKLYR